jgi:Kazal-type serine protease inhibitor domain
MKRGAFIPICALALAMLPCTGAVGCAAEEVVIATRTGPRAGAPNCTTNAECTAFEVCTRAACGDAAGLCETRPVTCSNTFAPSCGCDGVTYFNDCLRASNGTSLRRLGECGRDARRCVRDKTPCEGEAYCARFVSEGPQCTDPDRDPTGSCWVIPRNCDGSSNEDVWELCDKASPNTCVDICTAAVKGQAFVRRTRCGQAP